MKSTQNIQPPHRAGLGKGQGASERACVPRYRVGELFRRGRTEWPAGTQFRVGDSIDELTLFRREIGHELVQAVQRGRFEFALLVEQSFIVLAYQVPGVIPWEEAPFCWHLQHLSERVIPMLDSSPEARALLWISLVSATDGVVQAQRGVTLSPSFTRAIRDTVRRQAQVRFRPEACTDGLSRMYLGFPTTDDRLSLAVARSAGNE